MGTSTQQAGYWMAIVGNEDLKWDKLIKLILELIWFF
jgi:hypothetical protein